MQGISPQNNLLGQTGQNQQANKIFTMRNNANSRMGGSIPVWSKPQSPAEQVRENLQTSLNAPTTSKLPNHSQAYAPASKSGVSEDEFGFADFVDMINPLQHIPLVNIAYREITGDEIKPIAKIIGGAVFGGPIGAGSALIDTAIQAETGKDIAGHAFSMFSDEGFTDNKVAHTYDRPEVKLNAAIDSLAQNGGSGELGSAIAFADLGRANYTKEVRRPVADGRTAGYTVSHEASFGGKHHSAGSNIDPITQIHARPMPEKQDFNQ